jgi:hypothetical protein
MDLPTALERRTRFENGSASGRPPADWRLWMVDALAVERDIHGGTAGVADEEFYRSLYSYLTAQKAPAAVQQSFGFLHALSVYDFKAASVLADSLYPAAERGASWYPVDDLRDGATIAKLRLGDVDGATAYWRGLSSRSARPTSHLRTLMMFSYIVAANEARRAAVTAPAPR